MDLGKIGDQNVEFFKGRPSFFLRDQIGQTVQKLWPLKDRWARKKSVEIWKISFLFI